MGFARHFFRRKPPGGEYTWYPEIEEPIKSRKKYYSLVLYILTRDIKQFCSSSAYACAANVICENAH